MDLHFARQAWHLVTWTCILRGRRAAWWHGRAFCVAGVALIALGWLWWRAWFPVDGGRRGCLRGRRGTWRHRPSLCVAGVALGDMDAHSAWQAWHLWHWAGAWRLPTSTLTLRGTRGTWWHGHALCVARVALVALGWLWWRPWFPVDAVGTAVACVAGVALGDIDLHFAWQAWRLATWTFDMDIHFPCQAWHLWHWTGSGGALGSRLTPWAPRLFAWQAWHLATSTFTLRGRRGAWRHGRSTWTFTFRARRGTYGTGLALVLRLVPGWCRGRCGCLRGRRGTWRHRPSLCVEGVAWRGTWRHRRAFCVAGVALGDIHLHFAWQVWHLATSTYVLRGRHATWWHPRRKWVHLSQIRHCHPQLCHTQFFTHISLTCNFSLTHIFVTHSFVTHNSFTHNFLTHNSFTHNCMQLCHKQSFTHNFVTHTILHIHNFDTQLCHKQLCHTRLFHTHTTLSQTIFHTHLFHSQSFTHTHNSFTHNLSHTQLFTYNS